MWCFIKYIYLKFSHHSSSHCMAYYYFYCLIHISKWCLLKNYEYVIVNNYPFSRIPKSAIFRVLSALVKDSRQFKQHEKRLSKCVTVIYHYTNNYNILKSCISWCADSQTWEKQYPQNGGKIGREKGQLSSFMRFWVCAISSQLCEGWVWPLSNDQPRFGS